MALSLADIIAGMDIEPGVAHIQVIAREIPDGKDCKACRWNVAYECAVFGEKITKGKKCTSCITNRFIENCQIKEKRESE